ncbi:MAG TPA: DUF2298 domain-containing protein [Opitutaceae bacterium]|nr:DUF2298 domain-containing protein [Opitutaceae bacterium]
MPHLGLMFTLGLLAVNGWGLMLVAGAYWRNRWFALALGPWLGVTAVYAIECHHGLGRSLPGLGLLSSVASIGLIVFSLVSWEPAWLKGRWTASVREWRAEFAPRRTLGCLGVCAFLFLYAMLFRFTNPNIDDSSEKIADLSFICSYYTGATIPVPDAWLYPYLSTQYYSFQHYGAALMGRMLMLTPGMAYNIAFCALVALAGTAFSGVVFMLARKAWVRALVIAAFIVGGSGVTLLVHATETRVHPWTAMRFIGSAPMDRAPLGPWLKAYNARFGIWESQGRPMELPGEVFSYVTYLGDYHAPLSGYYLMGLCAMAMILWGRLRLARYAVIAGCTLTWTVLANTWVIPLQGLLVLAWLFANGPDCRRLVPAVAAGAAAVWLAAWVYLSAFTASTADYAASLRIVPWREHTPPLLFALFMLPTLALIALGLVSGGPQGRRLGMLWLTLLVFSEYFYVDDVYSGMYDRFNTTLKWWPWVMAGTLMTLGPVVLERAARRWTRVAGAFFCLYPCFYAGDLWGVLRHGPEGAAGRMEGSAYLTKEEFPRLMLGRLRVERPGVVVERPGKKAAFTDYSALPLLAGHRMWLGWYGHELLWRGYPADITRRSDQLALFYSGGMPDAGRWLLAQGIDYVLWYRPGDTPALWEKINAGIGPGYVWTDILTYPEAGRRAGFWRRIHSAVR